MTAAVESPWIHTVRQVIQDSDQSWFRVRPIRYWLDFVTSLVLAYSASSLYLWAEPFSYLQLAAFAVAVFWLYRLGSLVHEVAHLSNHEMRIYKVAWNLLVGVMTLTPSPFFTRHHRDHHSHRWYGTPEDPEYIVNLFEPGSPWSVVRYVLHLLAFPLLVFLRFLVTPLTFLHPRLRERVLSHASSLTMNRRYSRRVTGLDRRVLTALEWLCFVRAAAIPVAVCVGWTDWTRIPLLYALALGVLAMNQMRLLADHHFESHGEQLDMSNHIFDSCNFTGRDPLTWLFFPFSIRYHALHHLFPSLPYHNLAAAHRYLMRELPEDSPYRTLDQANWWTVAQRTLQRHTERRYVREA